MLCALFVYVYITYGKGRSKELYTKDMIIWDVDKESF
jgi:hypothetical protein